MLVKPFTTTLFLGISTIAVCSCWLGPLLRACDDVSCTDRAPRDPESPHVSSARRQLLGLWTAEAADGKWRYALRELDIGPGRCAIGYVDGAPAWCADWTVEPRGLGDDGVTLICGEQSLSVRFGPKPNAMTVDGKRFTRESIWEGEYEQGVPVGEWHEWHLGQGSTGERRRLRSVGQLVEGRRDRLWIRGMDGDRGVPTLELYREGKLIDSKFVWEHEGRISFR